MKRKLSIILCIALILGFIPTTSVSATNDGMEKSIDSFTIGKTNVSWGERLPIKINYRSPVEAISVTIHFYDQDRDQGFDIYRDLTTGNYQTYDDYSGEGKISFSRLIDTLYYPCGHYKVTVVTIVPSGYGSYINASSDMLGQELTIRDHNGNVTFEKRYGDGDTLNYLQNMKAGDSVILRDNSKIRKSYLDAIKGKDVTIIFPKGELYEINGTDITGETKDIEFYQGSSSDSFKTIDDFGNNTELPCRIKLTFDTEQLMKHIRKKTPSDLEGLNLYYSDGKKIALASTPMVVADTWSSLYVNYLGDTMVFASDIMQAAKPWGTDLKTLKGTNKGISITWSKETEDDLGLLSGYQICYSTNKSFTKNKKTITIKGADKSKKTIKGLKSKKKYYVKIRTYRIVEGKKCYSKWSKAKSVKTK